MSAGKRSGFSLIELVLAVGLLSILMLALIQLIDTSMRVWSRTEEQRERHQSASTILELLARDLAGCEGGPTGDLLFEWVGYDTDGDGVSGRLWPRLRLVRQATTADVLRLDPEAEIEARSLGLIEVCWMVAPRSGSTREERAIGVLWRGERRADGPDRSFLDEDFFDAAGKPPPGVLEEVSEAALHLELRFASQTSIVRDGWQLGSGLADCASAWDARGFDRPDIALSVFNEIAAGAAAPAADHGVLPRRVRVSFELERPIDLRRRARLQEELDAEATVLLADDDRHLPPVGTHVLIGEEWMEIRAVHGRRVNVLRAARGTRASFHPAGALMHHGLPLVREVPLPMAREDWSFQ